METFKQFIRFGVVGVSNTIIGYLIYVISLSVMRFYNMWVSYDIYVAQFIMFLLSVAWSFYWNNKYVFKGSINSKRDIIKSLLRTYVSYAFTSLILSEILLVLWVEYLTINDFIAPILSLLITVPLNFVIQKYWAFRGGEQNTKRAMRTRICVRIQKKY